MVLAGIACAGEDDEADSPSEARPQVALPGLIAYQATEPNGAEAVYVIRTDGSGRRRLAEGAEPAWSPDGTRIAFRRESDRGAAEVGIFDVFVMNADGSRARNLTRSAVGTGLNGHPTWSPDGRRLAFTSERACYELDREGMSLYVTDADGRRVRRLTECSSDHEPAWSPDGRRIAFVRFGEIAVLDLQTGSVRQVTRLEDRGEAHEPSWAPDGQAIAFARCCNEPNQTAPFYPDGWELYVVNADGSGLRRLLDRGRFDGQKHPTWSADGQWLAFTGHDYADRPTEGLVCEHVYVIRRDGSDARSVSRCPRRVPGDEYYWVGNAASPVWGG